MFTEMRKWLVSWLPATQGQLEQQNKKRKAENEAEKQLSAAEARLHAVQNEARLRTMELHVIEERVNSGLEAATKAVESLLKELEKTIIRCQELANLKAEVRKHKRDEKTLLYSNHELRNKLQEKTEVEQALITRIKKLEEKCVSRMEEKENVNRELATLRAEIPTAKIELDYLLSSIQAQKQILEISQRVWAEEENEANGKLKQIQASTNECEKKESELRGHIAALEPQLKELRDQVWSATQSNAARAARP